MGVDLTLLPYYSESELADFSHDMLNLERRHDLWGPITEIEKQHGRDVSENFTSFYGRSNDYDDACYGVTKDSPYGTHVKYIRAIHLKSLASHPAVTDNYKNKAIWAFICACPDNLKIALYWH